MQFLRINALKKELSEGSLKQSDVFGYWLATTVALRFGFPIPQDPTVWEYLYWALSAALAVVMLRRCYLENGGANGVKFSDKYVSISWVMFVRGVLMVLIPLLVVGSVSAALAGLSFGLDKEGVVAVVEVSILAVTLIFELWVWLRIAAHIRDVRQF